MSEQGQLQLLEPERSQWVEQIEQMQGSLAALVLGRLRENLAAWMRLESLQNPYRVQIWGNRLMALEMMLHYEEQTLLRTHFSHLSPAGLSLQN
ncbi:MAG: hypothetical protein ACUVRV_12265 [Cyanobacteriota bacterium]